MFLCERNGLAGSVLAPVGDVEGDVFQAEERPIRVLSRGGEQVLVAGLALAAPDEAAVPARLEVVVSEAAAFKERGVAPRRVLEAALGQRGVGRP